MLKARTWCLLAVLAAGCFGQSDRNGSWKTVKETSSGTVIYGGGCCTSGGGGYSTTTYYYIVNHEFVGRVVKASSEDYWVVYRGASNNFAISEWDELAAAKQAVTELAAKK